MQHYSALRDGVGSAACLLDRMVAAVAASPSGLLMFLQGGGLLQHALSLSKTAPGPTSWRA